VYCGAIGYVAPPDVDGPSCCFNVAIRTAVIDVEEGVAEYGVGGGIVWDSLAEAEYEETRAKAQLLVDRRPDFDLFETIRWDDDRGFWWLDEHLDRMEASAAYFGWPFDRAAARRAVGEAVEQRTGHLRIRLTSTRTGAVGVTVSEESLIPISEGPSLGDATVQVEVDDQPVSSHDVFLFHKTTHRNVYLDRRRRHPEADDVLLVNERGEVTESTIANLVVRFGQQWWTPALDSGCLPGIYRRVLLEKGVIRERFIALHELDAAEELGLINSVRGWRPAALIAPRLD
jgi:para-aminobenzoate synthetase/4-amino-4-deoxychorismate lyase